jgi:hypothetical protein
MSDVIILLGAFVLVALTGLALLKIIQVKNAIAARVRRERPRKLREDLDSTDEYIERVNSALSWEDLDGIEEEKDS